MLSYQRSPMSINTTIRLVKSLSGPEKRYFKLHSKKQSGNKDYLYLFDLIDKSEPCDPQHITEAFRKTHPGRSLANPAAYLQKVLLDCLIRSKMEKDVSFQLLQGAMRARVLRDRSLPEEAHKELKKIRKEALQSQQPVIEYLAYRYELNYFSDLNFQGITDESLVEMQMKAKEVLRRINQVQDHHSLFELLKHRLIHSGKATSERHRKKLNDLMLSEMTLVSHKGKNNFIAQKLHLLFQSFFFSDVGDPTSALKVFHELTRLFEKNVDQWDHPPLDYLSTLSGILDSLHSLKKFEESSYYLDKVQLLDQPDYPEYFRFLVRKTAASHQLGILTAGGEYGKAIAFIETFDDGLLRSYPMIDEERQWELYFYCSLAYFGRKDWKKAHFYISEIMKDAKAHPQKVICKATRLLNIIIHYEKGDREYLEYEIRGYKRFFGGNNRLLKSEMVVLNFIKKWCERKNIKKKKRPDELDELQKDRYERQLLRYFDFINWLDSFSWQ